MAWVEGGVGVARRGGVPGVITHVKALGPRVWGFGTVITQRIEAAREEGVEVYTDQYPYAASSTGLAAALLPRWAQAGGALRPARRGGRGRRGATAGGAVP